MKKYFYFCNKLLESSHQLPAEQPTRWDFSFNPNKIYPQLCCLVYWLNAIDRQNNCVAELKTLLLKYPIVNPSAMGFTSGWEQEDLWK